MCGICGQFNLDKSSVNKPLIKAMAETLKLRGPDDEGYYFDKELGLAHRRLSIIDLFQGCQPMANEDGSLIIITNGEIYNFIELRKELIARGHVFRTQSDTEVILHLYEEGGITGCLERLDGMFAFAIWDKRKRSLFLARDRFGIKPLHYYYDDKTFLFSSEIKSLFKYRRLNKELNMASLDQYLSLLYILEPNTILKKVHKLAAGHYLMVNDKGVFKKRYWDINFSNERIYSEKYYEENLIDKLNNSVKISLRSDVPVGIFLSGGVDSGAVAAFAAGQRSDLQTFSVSFKEKVYSEGDYSRMVANKWGFKHHEICVTQEDAVKNISAIASYLDEPFADSSCIPVFCLSQYARRYVKVVLTGDGGDELFAGYPWHTDNPVGNNGLKGILYHGSKIIMGEALREQLYLSKKNGLRPLNSYPHFNVNFRRFNRLGNLDKSLYLDCKGYLPSDMLCKVDRMTMMNSLEARLPLLNKEYAEFTAQIPHGLKLKETQRKYLFKKILRNRLPKKILNRPKMGFAIPMDAWMWQKGKFRNMVYDVLFDPLTRKRGYFDYRQIECMSREHDQFTRLYGYPMWTLFMFELWHRNFLDQ